MPSQQFIDQEVPEQVTTAVVPADPGEVVALRTRIDVAADPIVRLPLVGPGAAAIAFLSSPDAAHMPKFTAQATATKLAEWGMAAAIIASRLRQESNKAIDRLNSDEIARLVGYATDSVEFQLLNEVLASLNTTTSSVAVPLSATRLAQSLLDSAAITEWFGGTTAPLPVTGAKRVTAHPADLSEIAVESITMRAVARVFTGLANYSWGTAMGARIGAERTKAAIELLDRLAVFLCLPAFTGLTARLEALVAFLASPFISDMITDPVSIQLRAELTETMSRFRKFSMFKFQDVFTSYYAARKITINGKAMELLHLPIGVFDKAVRDHLSSMKAPKDIQIESHISIKIDGYSAFRGAVVNDTKDSLSTTAKSKISGTKSKLFDFRPISGRPLRTAMALSMSGLISSALQLASEMVRELRLTPEMALLHRVEQAAELVIKEVSSSTAIFDLAGFTVGDPNGDVPATLANDQASASVDRDIGYIKMRPLLPAAIHQYPQNAIAPFALMYSEGITERLEDLSAPEASYNGSKRLPRTTLFTRTSSHYLKASILATPELWQLWPACWHSRHQAAARTLDLNGLTQLMGSRGRSAMDAFAASREIIRVATADPEILADAFAHVGVVIKLKTASDSAKASIAIAEAIAGKSKPTASVILPKGSRNLLAGVTPLPQDQPAPLRTYFNSLSSLRQENLSSYADNTLQYATSSTSAGAQPPVDPAQLAAISSVLVCLDGIGELWFLPFTHQYTPIPLDAEKLQLSKHHDSWQTQLQQLAVYKSLSPYLSGSYRPAQQGAAAASPPASLNAGSIAVPSARIPGASPQAFNDGAIRFESGTITLTILEPMRGIVANGFDIRNTLVWALAAGEHHTTPVRAFYRRHTGEAASAQHPTPIGWAPAGSLLITTPGDEATSEYTPHSSRNRDDVATQIDDWLLLGGPSSILKASVL